MELYEVGVDVSRQLLFMTFRGFWDDATFDRFATEYSDALHLLHRHGGCCYTLVDASGFAVQPARISHRFRALIASLAPIGARRTATIVTGQLSKNQSERVTEAIAARSFSDRQEAETWLFAGA